MSDYIASLLSQANDKIDEQQARIDALEDKVERLEALPHKWRAESKDQFIWVEEVPDVNDAVAAELNHCADELEAALRGES